MRLGTAVATAVVVVGFAAPSYAATATTADGNLRYTAAAGEVNNVSFARVSGDTFRVTELGATIAAGTGCTQESASVVSCTTRRGRPIIAALGDQNDTARSRTSRRVQLFGQDGNDRLAGASGRDRLDGGNGDDNLTGGSGRDALRGGSGNDVLDGGFGSDVENGGSGDDGFSQGAVPNGADSLTGDTGVDTVDYGPRTARVEVTVDDVQNDGDIRVSERDNVRTTVDRVVGGAATDLLVGRDGADDTLVGGAGDDVLNPRRGNDHIDGGPGIDQLYLRDLSFDDAVCGDGVDSVAADARDTTGADCEKVRRTASMSLALEGRAVYPTVLFRLVCPPSAFKSCDGRVILRTLERVRTRTGARTLTIGVRRFSVPAGGSSVIGMRIRSAARPHLGRRGLAVRAGLSAYDGAGPARRDAIRFRLIRR